MACRVTPSASAPSATDSPSGSRQSYRTDSPGWEGFFMCIGLPLAPAMTFQFPMPFFRRTAKDSLYCSHRTMYRSSIFSLEGGLDGLPLRVSNEGLPILYTSLIKGAAKVALYCAHRTSTVLSCAFCEQEGHLATPSYLHLPQLRIDRPGRLQFTLHQHDRLHCQRT